MDLCKFCGYEGDDFRQCESGSYEDGDGNVVTTYCGNLECSQCFSCQGNVPTPELRAASALTRAIHENRPFCWAKRTGIFALGPTVHNADRLPESFR